MEKPDSALELQHVFGYRCSDSRQNCHWNCNGDVVYMTAALGVVMDMECNQKYFGGGEVANTAKNVANDMDAHCDDIMCLQVSEDRTTAVTG